MKLASLHIDRFGARSKLDLNDFTDQLNVVYGPNGAGKTTIIQFIRWMMFGGRDEISQRYLTTSSGPACGSMQVRDHAGTRRLERKSQFGSMLSQLSVDGPHGVTSQAPLRLSNVEFDRFFTCSFDQSRNIADLLNSAKRNGLQLHVDHRRLEQAQQLRSQIERHRSELGRFRYSDTLDQLTRAREEKRRQIESRRQDFLRRQTELQDQRNQLSIELSEPQTQVQRLQSVVSNIEQAIETRKRQLMEEQQAWMTARRELEERRQRRIAEIDGQLNRWQEILTEVRGRLEQVRARIASYSDVGVSPSDTTDLQFFMRQLGFRVRDIEQDLSGVYETETWRDHESDAEYLRGLLGSALTSIQSDVARLGQTVERQQQVNELHETREELNYLCRVEQELADLIDALARQRHQLGRAPGLSTETNAYSLFRPGNFDVLDGVPDQRVLDHLKPEHTTYQSSDHGVNWTPDFHHQSGSAVDLANTLNDFRIRHLADRRDSAVARLHKAQQTLSHLQQRLRSIDEELSRFGNDHQISHLEREIAEIDERMTHVHQRASIERAIASLEDQLRQLESQAGTSQVVDEATGFLRRLTDDAYTRIELQDSNRCLVTGRRDSSSAMSFGGRSHVDEHQFDYTQLSRGVQDQVYLSLVLAISNVFHRKGVIAPLILNDVFGNLDQSGSRALARLLCDFAMQDRQVLLFTRHDHVREQFDRTNARVFTLRERDPIVAPAPAPVESFVPPPIRPVYESAELPPPPSPSYKWVAEWQGRDPEPTTRFDNHRTDREPTNVLRTLEAHTYPSQQPQSVSIESVANSTLNKIAAIAEEEYLTSNQTESEPQLKLGDPLTDASVLTADFAGYMHRLDVHRVEEFLELDPDEAERQLGAHGITAEIVQRRQREIMMMVYVLTSASEAQLLVACGVPDPARLARADEAVLLKRIETILARPQAAERFGSVERYSLVRIQQWIESARRSDFRGRSRRSYTRSGLSRSNTTTRNRSNGSSQPSTRSISSSTKRSTKRTTSRSSTSRSSSSDTVKLSAKTGLKFYLEPNDPVVDAPSIGPKTAEKLHAVGVLTVSQLLSTEPADISERLGEKKFSPEVVEQWQRQAELVCCIPNLRGHDAQILVGCGVEDPVTLSSMDASSFLRTVSEFVESKEGQRAIRNAKKPDLAEVTAWIEWSESARQLRAA